MGRDLVVEVMALSWMWEEVEDRGRAAHCPIFVPTVRAVGAVEEAYLYSLSRDLLSAAVRLGILGPMHGNPQPRHSQPHSEESSPAIDA